MANNIKIQHTVFTKGYYWFCRINYFVQNDISQTINHFFLVPLFSIIKWKNPLPPNIKKERPGYIRFDTLKSPNLWKIYNWVCIVSRKVSGVFPEHEIHKTLTDWNEDYPIIAFKYGKTLKRVDLLFEDSEWDKSARRCDIGFYSERHEMGTFKIIEKYLEKRVSDESIIIKCVWLSGVNKGEIFKIKKYLQEYNQLLQTDRIGYIYKPPSLMLFIFEILFTTSLFWFLFQKAFPAVLSNV